MRETEKVILNDLFDDETTKYDELRIPSETKTESEHNYLASLEYELLRICIGRVVKDWIFDESGSTTERGM